MAGTRFANCRFPLSFAVFAVNLSQHATETVRLKRLQQLNILDTQEEQSFDYFVSIAARAASAPIALITFIDDRRTWCKAAWGCERGEVARERSLCWMALQQDVPLIIPNIATDERYHDCVSVCDMAETVSYCGITIRSLDGIPLGTLCVIDSTARDIGTGVLDELLAIAEQVSQLIELYSQRAIIARQESQIDQSQQHRDQFLAMLAHELRAPLAPILTAVQILRRDETTVDQRSWAKNLIHRHVRYMSEIVTHVLSASNVSTGAVVLQFEPVRVDDILRDAYEMSEDAIRTAQHRYVAPPSDAWVTADQTQAIVMVSHLLTNAARFMPDQGQIDVRVDTDNAHVRIAIKDTGVGIAEHEREEIFEMFGQSRQPLDRARGGMGFGLALSRRIAEWHGGVLTVSSEGIGKGSEFALTLKRAHPPQGGHAPPDNGDHEVRSPLELLIVEDNVDTAEALALYLDLSGHKVRIAHTAEEALLMVGKCRPDVVLSDIGLPDTDGYALIRKLRSLTSLINTAFIAITGYAGEQDRRAAIKAGFDAHFGKPVDLPKLEETLDQLLSPTQPRPPQ